MPETRFALGDASYASAPALRPTSDIARAVFADPESRAFEARLALLAPTDTTILIVGETGTGKEVAARQLHALSGRRGPFVAVNCAALSESLADSELFGHERGAFTGAVKAQQGWFEAAAGGTLLLDEIGELPLPLQTKLLRVLQEREVTRVGSRTARPIDARVIAATNLDLHAAVEEGRFRRDLLFRLDVATVRLRPLRQRREDIEPLAGYFLELYRQKFSRPQQSFSADALSALRHYDWPGNIRELDNVVHRAVLLSAGEMITAAELAPHIPASGRIVLPAAEGDASGLEHALGQLAQAWMQAREPELLDRVTRVLVQTSFDQAGGNQVRAADILGVTRNTLRTQLGHLGLIAPRRRKADIEGGTCMRVRIGIQKFGTTALLRQDAELENSLRQRGIAVEWQDFPTGPPLMEALRCGDLDIGSTGEVPPIFAQAAGTRLVYLAYEPAAPTSIALVVPRGARIDSVHDLRGRRVALSRGANVHFMLVRALERDGLTLNDIEPVYLASHLHPSPDTIGTVDAWAMWDPYLSEVQHRRDFRVLLDGTGLVGNRRFYVARRQFAEAMPDLVDDILRCAFRVGAQAAMEPAATASRLAEPFGMLSEGLEVAMRRIGQGARRLETDILNEQQAIADHFYALGIVGGPISVFDAVWPTPEG